MEEATVGFGDTEWKTSRIHRRKDKGSDLVIHAEESFEVEMPESVWKCNTYYVVIDTLLVSLRITNHYCNRLLCFRLSIQCVSTNGEMSTIPGSSVLREIQFGFL